MTESWCPDILDLDPELNIKKEKKQWTEESWCPENLDLDPELDIKMSPALLLLILIQNHSSLLASDTVSAHAQCSQGELKYWAYIIPLNARKCFSLLLILLECTVQWSYYISVYYISTNINSMSRYSFRYAVRSFCMWLLCWWDIYETKNLSSSFIQVLLRSMLLALEGVGMLPLQLLYKSIFFKKC